MGDGRHYMPWIHIDDVVGLMLHAMDHPEVGEVLNVAAPTPVSNAEFTRALGRALHRPTVLPVPAFALRLLGDMGSELLLAGQRISVEKAVSTGYRFRFADIDTALADLLA